MVVLLDPRYDNEEFRLLIVFAGKYALGAFVSSERVI